MDGPWQGPAITRRAVFAGVGVTLAGTAIGQETLTVAHADGGFLVRIGYHEVWRVTGAEIRRFWGEAAKPEIDLSWATPAVTIAGRLLGQTSMLRLWFGRDGQGWECRLSLILSGLSKVQGVTRLPSSLTPSEPSFLISVGAEAWAVAAGLPRNSVLHRWRPLEIGWNLKPVLAGPLQFKPLRRSRWHWFTAQGPLELLPADGAGSPPRSRLQLGPPDTLALADEFHVEPSKMCAEFPARNPGDYAIFSGEGALHVGQTRFRGDSTSCVRISKDPTHDWSWSAEWRLPTDDEQAIETPQGHFNVTGSGKTDVEAEGTAYAVRQFSASARLCHAGLRLPLDDSSSDFVEIGRLDFDKSPGTPIAFTLDRFGKSDKPSYLALERDAPETGRIRLDGARLFVVREADMFWGCFRFTGVLLHLGRNRHRLVSALSPAQDASLLRVDLPPQHVVERSFARQLPVLPGRDLKQDELAKVRDVEGRGQLQTALAADDPAFKPFADDYRTSYEDAASRKLFSPPSQAIQNLEKIYIGRDGLITLFGRRIANATAFARRQPPRLADVPLGLGLIDVGTILAKRLQGGTWTPTLALLAIRDLLAKAEDTSDDHRVIQTAYRQANPGANGRFYSKEWVDRWPKELPQSEAQANLATMVGTLPSNHPFPPATDLQKALDDAYSDQPARNFPVLAAAAGATRLVFALSGLEGAGRSYCLTTLLSWTDYDLRVTRRAERFEVDTTPQDLARALERQKIPPTTRVKDRMDKVFAVANTWPSDLESAIELPGHLLLSPAQDIKFDPTPAPRRMAEHGVAPTPLWQANLREKPGRRYSLRAVASPDFNPNSFKGPDGNVLPPAHGKDKIQSALDARDRHEVVGLSSLYGLPIIARRSGEDFEQSSQVAPPSGYALENLFAGEKDGQALYIPRPLPARRLALSPIGASLDLDAPFVPPAAVHDSAGTNLFEAFTIARWRSLISFGRDVTTEVVYKGFLYPIGFPATLVKVTERFFAPWPERESPSFPVALLRQRLFVKVGSPTKKFPAVGQPFIGRAWPAQSLVLDTDHTPDLLNPVRYGDVRPTSGDWQEQPNGRLDHPFRAGLVFWPRVSPGKSGNIRFRMKIDDRPEPVSMPLIFVDNEAAHNSRTMRLLRAYYNNRPDELRRLDHQGVRRRYAPEEKPGDTSCATLEWLVEASGPFETDRRIGSS